MWGQQWQNGGCSSPRLFLLSIITCFIFERRERKGNGSMFGSGKVLVVNGVKRNKDRAHYPQDGTGRWLPQGTAATSTIEEPHTRPGELSSLPVSWDTCYLSKEFQGSEYQWEEVGPVAIRRAPPRHPQLLQRGRGPRLVPGRDWNQRPCAGSC